MTISILGMGNVGYHLLQVLSPLHHIVQVYNRTASKLETILQQFPHIDFTTELTHLLPADLYILAIKDDQIASVAEQLCVPANSLVVHTSGTVSSVVLHCFENHGIFYPLQTIRQQQAVAWQNIPICITANKPETEQLLMALGQQIAQNVYAISNEQRQWLHLAAVFVNNFTNHLYCMAHNIVSQHQIPFELLKPLIIETAQKIQHQAPFEVQTGPAIRHDQQTIDTHLALLHDSFPQYSAIYTWFSDSIGAAHRSS
ncbi:MAG: DUF2520 domain-containing protein [Chitinophagales bacterium]|nr:DUF2520 domain-containing protein [Chitinophagales bacterium]